MLSRLDHIGYVVNDAHAELARLEDVLGLSRNRNEYQGDWRNALYRGERIDFGALYLFASLGDTDIEIISPTVVDQVSPYTNFLATRGQGVHHLAFFVDSIDAELRDKPAAIVVLDAAMGNGGRFAYVEDLLEGVLVELIETPPTSAGSA